MPLFPTGRKNTSRNLGKWHFCLIFAIATKVKCMNNKENPKYPGCYWCDNIIDYYGMIGLLHLDFPRCFILIPDDNAFEFSDYDSWRENLAQINWLDPSEQWSEADKERVITKLWNFSVEYDRKNEELFDDDILDMIDEERRGL